MAEPQQLLEDLRSIVAKSENQEAKLNILVASGEVIVLGNTFWFEEKEKRVELQLYYFEALRNHANYSEVTAKDLKEASLALGSGEVSVLLDIKGRSPKTTYESVCVSCGFARSGAGVGKDALLEANERHKTKCKNTLESRCSILDEHVTVSIEIWTRTKLNHKRKREDKPWSQIELQVDDLSFNLEPPQPAHDLCSLLRAELAETMTASYWKLLLEVANVTLATQTEPGSEEGSIVRAVEHIFNVKVKVLGPEDCADEFSVNNFLTVRPEGTPQLLVVHRLPEGLYTIDRARSSR